MREKLALYGGKPVRIRPFPSRTPFGEEEIKEVTEAINSQNLFYTSGNKVFTFEKKFREKYKVKYAITSTSGTAAIHLAIAAINPDPGDEIITAPVTDFGTIVGIIFQGAIPIFADWKPDTYNMDPEDIEKKISEKTKAILVVHLFGNPCDMDAIMKIAQKYHLPVIEDACQSYCTPYKGKWVGTIGDIGCFSMQQSKHLTTGDGGVTITDNENYAERMRLFGDKGWSNRDSKWGNPRAYRFLGLTYRMNELTGAVALAQLGKVEKVVTRMNELGDLLTELIKNVPGIKPAPVTSGAKHSYWLYPFKIVDFNPQEFIKALQAEGIPVSLGYTVKPIYLCAAALTEKRTFGNSGYPFSSPYYSKKIEYKEGLCPVVEEELKKIGTLRIYETWSGKDIQDVAKAIRKVAIGLKRN